MVSNFVILYIFTNINQILNLTLLKHLNFIMVITLLLITKAFYMSSFKN